MEKLNSKPKKDKDKEKEKTPPPKAQSLKLAKEFAGLFFLFLGALIFVSLISYSPSDPTLNTSLPQNAVIQNHVGLIGAYLSALLVDFFGLGSYVWSFLFIGLGGGFVTKWLLIAWWRFLGYILFGISLITLASAWSLQIHTILGGGYAGDYLYILCLHYFSPVGSAFIWLFILLFSTQLIFGISWLSLFRTVFSMLGKAIVRFFSKSKEQKDTVIINDPTIKHKEKTSFFSFLKRKKKENDIPTPSLEIKTSDDALSATEKEELQNTIFNLNTDLSEESDKEEEITELDASQIAEPKKTKKKNDWQLFGKKKEETPQKKESPKDNFILPNPQLLSVTELTEVKFNKKQCEEKGQDLIDALLEYNVDAKLEKITPGPVVTMFEVRLAPGVRVGKITSLENDLAMKLKAVRIRIQAPIPGSDTVGIEIPNEMRANVSFRELIEGESFNKSNSLLSLAIGKDISGAPYTTNLATMPHLLVAGATGTGKSVSLNTILLSMLYKAKPTEVKLLLVDPKRVELSIYQDLPHLVHPVITEMELAKNALLWATDEMERRYKLLEDMKVRNITGYNEKLFSNTQPHKDKNNKIYVDNENKEIVHEFMPYLVIIIDELADLMMMHGKDVEHSIVRLGQKARAAGMHIILATQRPSVNVVTGLIKTNCPGRISFQVTSKVDSRTIIDTQGAEALLGKGDMLFKTDRGTLERLHGAFVPDNDVEKVVEFWKKQAKPDYRLDFTAYAESEKEGTQEVLFQPKDISDDPVYKKAIEILPTIEKFSISALQRRLGVGFNKAANITEQLKRDGLI